MLLIRVFLDEVNPLEGGSQHRERVHTTADSDHLFWQIFAKGEGKPSADRVAKLTGVRLLCQYTASLGYHELVPRFVAAWVSKRAPVSAELNLLATAREERSRT